MLRTGFNSIKKRQKKKKIDKNINTNGKKNNARFSVYSGRVDHPPSASVIATKKIPVDAEIFVAYGPRTPQFLNRAQVKAQQLQPRPNGRSTKPHKR